MPVPPTTAKPPAPTLAATQAREQVGKKIPGTWQALVERWKQAKPIQARVLEEVKPIAYSAERIELAVAENCLAARALLQEDGKQKFVRALQELFAFRGSFSVVKLGKEHAERTSLLDKKQELKDKQQQQLLSEADNAPLTTGLREKFGAKIVDVRFPQS